MSDYTAGALGARGTLRWTQLATLDEAGSTANGSIVLKKKGPLAVKAPGSRQRAVRARA
jgi:hypothetical protein